MSDEKNDNPDADTIRNMLPLRMTSTVVRGFGRGSTDLGIPTANLDRTAIKVYQATTTTTGTEAARDSTSDYSVQMIKFDDLPCGIYWGFCRIGEKLANDEGGGDGAIVYKTAVSIGFNPTYNNKEKTIEPHLIAPPKDSRRHASSCGETLMGEFYDQPIRLSVVGYLRPEAPFEGLEKLIEAIKGDIVNAEIMGDSTDSAIIAEKEWVAEEPEA